jgi:hypothetical protein
VIPPGLRVGLQEWAVCCKALRDGRACLLVRKGGIHEPRGGTFAPEHQRFALLPSYLHQRADRLAPVYGGDYLGQVAAHPAPGKIPVTVWAEVVRVWKATDLARVQALGDELLWSADEIAARFAYRAQPFLFVLALRAHSLPGAVDIPDRPSYGGCRSWIALEDSVPMDGSTPAVADAEFATRLAAIGKTLG